jgi:hypothetical protein
LRKPKFSGQNVRSFLIELFSGRKAPQIQSDADQHPLGLHGTQAAQQELAESTRA